MSGGSIQFVALVPWLWLLGAGLVVAVLIGFGLWRRARGVGLRALAAAVLILTLAGPIFVVEQHRAQPDVVLVVRDVSASQGLGDRHAATDHDVAYFRQKLSGIPALDLRVVEAGAESDSLDGDQGTRLFAAVDQALADIPKARVAGIVLVTDGQVHDVPPPSQRRFDAPLHVLLTGHPGEGDRRLILKQVPGFGIVGKSVPIVLRVEDIGGTAFERRE